MNTIPPVLVRSLNTLGLTNDEARVYATLVLFDHAEAKEIVDYLSLSKPSVYKALGVLAERGLAIQLKTKPARYRAVSPEIAVSILMRDHETASEQALLALKKLEQEKVRTGEGDSLWAIYGDANIEYKIQELFRKAKSHVSCVAGDWYLRFLENAPARDIPLRLIIISSSPLLEEKLRKKFRGKNTEVHRIPLESVSSPPPLVAVPEIERAWKYLKFENVLELNVDDEELLMGVAFFSDGSSVLNTRNKGAIIQMKMWNQLFWNWFLGPDAKQPS